MKTGIFLILTLSLLLGCTKSNENLSVDERWHKYEKASGKSCNALLKSSKKITKNSNFTEKEIWIISEAYRVFFISGCGMIGMPVLSENIWQTKLKIGYGLNYVGDLKINNETGMISYKNKDVGLWNDLVKSIK